jgi:hypothetical protein
MKRGKKFVYSRASVWSIENQTANKGVFANEIASKSAIITNELSRLKVVSFSQYEYIVEIRDEKQNYISKTIG